MVHTAKCCSCLKQSLDLHRRGFKAQRETIHKIGFEEEISNDWRNKVENFVHFNAKAENSGVNFALNAKRLL